MTDGGVNEYCGKGDEPVWSSRLLRDCGQDIARVDQLVKG